MKLLNYIMFFAIFVGSLAIFADCPDADRVICQHTQYPRLSQTLGTAKFGTCWSWSSFNCGFCGTSKAEKDQECRSKVGPSFEARMPYFN